MLIFCKLFEKFAGQFSSATKVRPLSIGARKAVVAALILVGYGLCAEIELKNPIYRIFLQEWQNFLSLGLRIQAKRSNFDLKSRLCAFANS